MHVYDCLGVADLRTGESVDSSATLPEAQTFCIQADSRSFEYTFLAEVTHYNMDYDDNVINTASFVDERMRGQHGYDIERFLERFDDDLRYYGDEGGEPCYDDVLFLYLPSQRGALLVVVCLRDDGLHSYVCAASRLDAAGFPCPQAGRATAASKHNAAPPRNVHA